MSARSTIFRNRFEQGGYKLVTSRRNKKGVTETISQLHLIGGS